MKKFYYVYTQKEYGAEKFDVLDDDNSIIMADDENEAKEFALDYIRETSLYDKDETEKWIGDNPVFAEKVEVNADNFLILANIYIDNQRYYSKHITFTEKVKDFASSFLSHDELYKILDESPDHEFDEMYGLEDLLEDYTGVSKSEYDDMGEWYNEAMSRYATFI